MMQPIETDAGSGQRKQNILPRNATSRDEEHMTTYNAARIVAKQYLDVEWKRFKDETGTRS